MTSFSQRTVTVPIIVFLVGWVCTVLVITPDWLSYAAGSAVTSLLLLSILLTIAGASVYRHPITLWHPITWFLVTSGVYYGAGPLVYVLGSTETIEYSNQFYSVDDRALFDTSILSALGITTVLTFYEGTIRLFARRHRPGRASFATAEGQNVLLLRAAILFIAIGAPIKLFISLPLALGLIESTVPRSIDLFGVFSLLGVIPLFVLASRGFHRSRLTLVLLTAFEVIVALLTLSKLQILQIGVAYALAAALLNRHVKFLAGLAVIATASYVIVLSPAISYGRVAFDVAGLRSSEDAASFLNDVSSGNATQTVRELLPGVQGWWSRLNYTNAQAFAIDSYDSGNPGSSLRDAIWSFLPRILFPEKPVMTLGSEFNLLVLGNDHSKSAPGIFAEGYWNAGWLGLFFVSGLMGALYALLELYAAPRLESLNLPFIPVIWVGLFTAIQQDSWFVPTILGTIPMLVALHLLGVVCQPLLRQRQRGAS